MKTSMTVRLLFTALFPILAHAGVGSHGGNEVELEAWSYARAAAYMTQTNGDQFDLNPQEIDFLYQAMTGAMPIKVEETDETLYDDKGKVKTAINIPSKKLIRINRARWNKVEDASRFGLIAHEFMGAAGSTLDLNYKISSQMKPAYQTIYQNGSPVYFGGIYQKVSCENDDHYTPPTSPKYGTLMLKQGSEGNYQLYVDGVFSRDCRNPKTNLPEPTNLIANENLIVQSPAGALQLWVYKVLSTQLPYGETINGYGGSCAFNGKNVWSTLPGNEVIYTHVDNPKDSAFDRKFKQTLAIAANLQAAVSEGKCSIPFFPGIKTWINRRAPAERVLLKELRQTIGYFEAIKNGSEKIDLEKLPQLAGEQDFTMAFTLGKFTAEDFKRSGITLKDYALSQYVHFNHLKTLTQNFGYSVDEIVTHVLQVDSWGGVGLQSIVSPFVEENEENGISVTTLKSHGISALDLVNAIPMRHYQMSDDARPFHHSKKCKDDDYACNSKALAKFVTKYYATPEVFSDLKEADTTENEIHMLVSGLLLNGENLANYALSNELGAKLLINNQRLSYADFKHVIDPVLALKHAPRWYFYNGDAREIRNLKAVLEGKTDDETGLKNLFQAFLPHQVCNDSYDKCRNPVAAKWNKWNALESFLHGGVRIPMIRKLADDLGLADGGSTHIEKVELIVYHLGSEIPAVMKNGGATCSDLRWLGFVKSEIRTAGVCL